MSTDSLHKQLSQVQDTAYAYHHKFFDAVVVSKMFNNKIDTIYCTDKKGSLWKLRIDYNAEAILMLKTGEAKHMVIKTMFLKDSLLYGQGALINSEMHVKFNDILRVRLKIPEYTGAGER